MANQSSPVRKDSISLMATPRKLVGIYNSSERLFIMHLVTRCSRKWHNHNPWDPIWKCRRELANEIGVSESFVSRMNKKIKDGGVPFMTCEVRSVSGLNRVTYYTVDYEKYLKFCFPLEHANQTSKNTHQSCKKDTAVVSNDTAVVSKETTDTLYISLTNINHSLTPHSLPTLSQEADVLEEDSGVRSEEDFNLVSGNSHGLATDVPQIDLPQQMLEIFNRWTGSNESYVPKYDEKRAKEALADKCDGSLEKWDEYCLIASQNDFEMGRTKTDSGYKLWFSKAIDPNKIDWIRRKHERKTASKYVQPNSYNQPTVSSVERYASLGTPVYVQPVAQEDTRGRYNYKKHSVETTTEPPVGQSVASDVSPYHKTSTGSPASLKGIVQGIVGGSADHAAKPNATSKPYGYSARIDNDKVDPSDPTVIERINKWRKCA